MAEKARKEALGRELAAARASKARGMGRGLAAILAASPKDEPEELRRIPVELIDRNPNQPRRQFDDESLAALLFTDKRDCIDAWLAAVARSLDWRGALAGR